jgi:glycerophosphoryl diester phosphodiesterase
MVDLDIKMAGLEEAVLASLRRRPSVEALLTSFSPRVVRRLRDLNSALETGWIVGTRQPRNWLQRLESTGARWFVVEWACLNVQLATECRTRGIPLAVWTVNGRSEIGAAVRTPGVAAVITDVPDVAGDVRDLSLREPVSGSLPDYA